MDFDRLRGVLVPELFDENKQAYRGYEFQHGWNAALRFAFRQMELIEIQVERDKQAIRPVAIPPMEASLDWPPGRVIGETY